MHGEHLRQPDVPASYQPPFRPSRPAVSDEVIWVAASNLPLAVEIDSVSATISRQLAVDVGQWPTVGALLGPGPLQGAALAAGGLWIASSAAGGVIRFALDNAVQQAFIPIADRYFNLRGAGGRVWLEGHLPSRLGTIDAESLDVRWLELDLDSYRYAVGDDRLWVAGERGMANFLLQIDRDLVGTKTTALPDGHVSAVAAGADAVWLLLHQLQRDGKVELVRLDGQSAQVAATFKPPMRPYWLAIGPNALWTGTIASHRPTVSIVARIDPESGRIEHMIELAGHLRSLDYAAQAVWCTFDEPPGTAKLLRLDGALAGITAELDFSSVDVSAYRMAANELEAFERELLAEVERQMPTLRAWSAVAFEEGRIEGHYPDTEMVLMFQVESWKGRPGRRYGWRTPVWPLGEGNAEREAFIAVLIPIMEEIDTGGRLPDDAPEGEVQWLS